MTGNRSAPCHAYQNGTSIVFYTFYYTLYCVHVLISSVSSTIAFIFIFFVGAPSWWRLYLKDNLKFSAAETNVYRVYDPLLPHFISSLENFNVR